MADNIETLNSVDVGSIRESAKLFLAENAIIEIRVTCHGVPTRNGFYNSVDALVHDASNLTGQYVKAVYATLNPVKPELLNRRPNALDVVATGKAASDSDIVSRRWMLIDCDPERAAYTNSTDEEKAAARYLADSIREQLRAQDWPAPVLADSGNGWHLLYRIDLPANDEELIKACLNHLSGLNWGGAKVDTSVFNPSRITKLYGTPTRKGPHSVERPQRISRIVEIPDVIEVVPRKLLEEMVGRSHSARPPASIAKRAGAYLAKVDPSIAGQRGHDAALYAACCLTRGFGLSKEEALPLMHEFNQRCVPPWENKDLERKLDEAIKKTAEEPHRIGEKLRGQPRQNEAVQLAGELRLSDVNGRTDIANSRRFLAKYGDKVQYCHPWKKWLVWDGRRWEVDASGAILRLGKDVAESLWHEVAKTDMGAKITAFAKASCSEAGIKSMLGLVAAEVPIAPSEMDANPWLLNCPNGTVDLRTGELRDHRREDNITKLCPTNFDPEAASYSWDLFLESVFPDGGVIAFIQRFFGYALTGQVQEQLMALFHGGGSNGKSTLLSAIQGVFGQDYSTSAPESLLMARNFDSHPTEMATLHGQRLVVSQETDQGRKLDEARVKRLTGGDRISARKCKEDFWDFAPTHKLVQSTNHLPIISGSDDAIWRRLAVVPFTEKFWNPDNGETGPEPLRQDKKLSEKLRAEAEGILAWMVRGCLEWQHGGMQIPNTIRAVTRDYRKDQDVMGRFIEEQCNKIEGASLKFSDLYRTLTKWGDDNGQDVPDKKTTGQWLDRHGFYSKRGAKGARMRVGIELAG